MRTTCVFCEASIDADANGIYQLVEGWERNRKQGGTNAIRLPHRKAQWACHACIEARVRGVEQQSSLW